MNCLQNSEEYNHELKYIITLDGGTTNTRAYLWRQDGSFVSSKKERAGVRNTAMDGSDQVIRETVKRCIDGLIEESHIEESQVQGIFCSGMLTSNVGLEEIPYLCAPVDERALCNAIECRFFNDITRIPFYMIPGVRNHVENIGIDTLEQIDVMRGEETEAVALLRERGKGEGLIFVLPGSHTKIIYANEEGFICRCKTTMSGELLDALFFHTLLKDSLPDFFVGEEEYDYQAVSDGARTAQKNSFTSAVFKTRIYQKYVHKDKKKAANFLLGVLMYYDCLSICEFKKTEALEEVQFVIAGKRIIAQAVYDILTDIMQEKKVHLLDEDELMAAKGAFRLAELYYKWKVSRMMSDLKDRLLEEKLIVILRGLAEEKLIATVDILKNMGMHFFELAIDNESELSMEKSLRNIEGLRKHYGDSIHIGAGTVINKLQVKRVAEIGGEYIISPNLNEEVIRATKEMGLVSIPGAATPSEIIRAYQEGADIVKVFPANYLGEAYIRAIKAPLDYIPIAAVGGIRPEDISAFQSAGVSCFGVGKQLVDAGLFSSYCDEEVFQIIEDRAKRYLQAIR